MDLAKCFVNGADRAKDKVCLMYADPTAWGNARKASLTQRNLDGGGAVVNGFLPGSVVFAPQALLPGLPAGAPATLYQL